MKWSLGENNINEILHIKWVLNYKTKWKCIPYDLWAICRFQTWKWYCNGAEINLKYMIGYELISGKYVENPSIIIITLDNIRKNVQ